MLLQKYVQSAKREKKVLADMAKLPQAEKLMSYQTCWVQCGENGKAHIADELGALAIFDDHRGICEGADFWGIQTYPIMTKREQHRWHHQQFATFADAVDAFLRVNFY